MDPEQVDVDAYLARIGWSGPLAVDLATLAALQRAHLGTVPFTNVDVFCHRPVSVHAAASLRTVVDERRGGWCFVNNGAFAVLLEAIGFDVRRLGAAVLLNGPNRVVDHLTLEVTLDEAYLVDVGFGRHGPFGPLPLASPDPTTVGGMTFDFEPSPEGLTLVELVDEVPHALYRFRRVTVTLDDLEPASDALQQDRSLHWSTQPFATRVCDGDGTRLTLTADRLTRRGVGIDETAPIDAATFDAALATHFGIEDEIGRRLTAP